MTRLLMLVEGQSERLFVKRTLAPHLEKYGVFASPTLLWTKREPGGGGFRGATSWAQIRRDLLRLIGDGDAWISTLLDFYGLPGDFPGRQEALSAGDPYKKVVSLQERFATEMNHHQRFIPFFALHEFEAWLFSSPKTVETHYDKERLGERLQTVVRQAGAPELINHGPDTHPKAQLDSLVDGYKETSDGPTLMGKIGLATIRAECPHFDEWLRRLEALGGGTA